MKKNEPKRTVTRTERGWAGHFICSADCLFRRNTLLVCGDVEVVVSTVGLMRNVLYGKKGLPYPEMGKNRFEEIGLGRYYETMAFLADATDKRYHDIDVDKQIYFNSRWAIAEIDADDRANDMHETVVAELVAKMESGCALLP